MRRVVISGLVALAAALGGVAVPAAAMAQPATAMAQPTTAARPTAAVRPGMTAQPADVALVDTGLPAVSCVLTTDCLGTEGSSSISDGEPSTPTRIERWNGSSWKRLGVRMPTGTVADDVNSASCKTAKSCLVVGDYYTSTSGSPASHVLALSSNGTTLRPTPTVPLPKGTTDAVLSGVSCVTARHCVALGVADGATAAFGDDGSLIIIETWNGAKWTLHSAAASIGSTTMLVPSVVSCATTTFCVLAGTAYSATVKPYVASWNGKKLTTMKPAPAGGSADVVVANGVSCATASNCAVTGANLGPASSGTSTATSTAFTQIWNGKTWQLAKVTWPKADVSPFTSGVSCYAAHSCEAVGMDSASDSETSPYDATAASFKGRAGTVQSVPAPPKGDSDEFAAVSCLPWGSCVAIGETGTTTATSLAVMTGVWNGKVWKLHPGWA